MFGGVRLVQVFELKVLVSDADTARAIHTVLADVAESIIAHFVHNAVLHHLADGGVDRGNTSPLMRTIHKNSLMSSLE